MERPMSRSQELDDAGLDRAFERIAESGDARLNRDALVRLVLFLANTVAIQDETAVILSEEGRPSRDRVEDLLQKVEDNRSNFKRLVAEIAGSVPEPAQ